MARYILFAVADGSTILIEVEGEEVSAQPGVVKAGLKQKVDEAVSLAQTTFEDALEGVVRYNAQAFLQAVHSLTESPAQAEMTFALKATGEVGNVAVARLGGEANYTIKLVWKPEAEDEV